MDYVLTAEMISACLHHNLIRISFINITLNFAPQTHKEPF